MRAFRGFADRRALQQDPKRRVPLSAVFECGGEGPFATNDPSGPRQADTAVQSEVDKYNPREHTWYSRRYEYIPKEIIAFKHTGREPLESIIAAAAELNPAWSEADVRDSVVNQRRDQKQTTYELLCKKYYRAFASSGDDLTLKQIRAYIHDFSNKVENESSESLNSLQRLHPASPPSGQNPNWLSFIKSWSPAASKVNSRAQSPRVGSETQDPTSQIKAPASPEVLTNLRATKNQRHLQQLSGKKKKVTNPVQSEPRFASNVRRVLKDVFEPLYRNSPDAKAAKDLIVMEKDKDQSIREVDEESSYLPVLTPENIVKIKSPTRMFSRNGLDARYKLTVLEKLKGENFAKNNASPIKDRVLVPSKSALSRGGSSNVSMHTDNLSKHTTPNLTSRNKQHASGSKQDHPAVNMTVKESTKQLRSLASKKVQATFDKKYSQAVKTKTIKRFESQKVSPALSANESLVIQGPIPSFFLRASLSTNYSPHGSPKLEKSTNMYSQNQWESVLIPNSLSLDYLSVLTPERFFSILNGKLSQRGMKLVKTGNKAEVLGESFEYVSNHDGVSYSVISSSGRFTNSELLQLLAEVCVML